MALALLAPSCSPEPGADEAGAPADEGFEEVYTGGPVSLAVRLDRREIDLADQLRLEMELRVEEGFEADFPEYLPEDFEGFAVVDVDRPPAPEPEEADAASPAPEGGSSPPRETRRTKRFVLEPNRSGDLSIAPLEVFFYEEGATGESSFRTDEIPVRVRPIEDAAQLDVHPPLGILEAPPEPSSPGPLVWALAGLATFATAGVILWLLLRKRPLASPPPPPPHEVAWENLRRLVALDLVAQGEIETFFVHLSAILRHYIEERFPVRAEELTTEEFLIAAARAPELATHRDRLAEFLNLSDQVKFARFEPDQTVIQRSFDTVKKFIAETTPGERGSEATAGTPAGGEGVGS